MTTDPMFELVRAELMALDLGTDPSTISTRSLLIEDIGLSSLALAELTAGLENALNVGFFPMRDWIDQCRDRNEPLTVGALAAFCTTVVLRENAET